MFEVKIDGYERVEVVILPHPSNFKRYLREIFHRTLPYDVDNDVYFYFQNRKKIGVYALTPIRPNILDLEVEKDHTPPEIVFEFLSPEDEPSYRTFGEYHKTWE